MEYWLQTKKKRRDSLLILSWFGNKNVVWNWTGYHSVCDNVSYSFSKAQCCPGGKSMDTDNFANVLLKHFF